MIYLFKYLLVLQLCFFPTGREKKKKKSHIFQQQEAQKHTDSIPKESDNLHLFSSTHSPFSAILRLLNIWNYCNRQGPSKTNFYGLMTQFHVQQLIFLFTQFSETNPLFQLMLYNKDSTELSHPAGISQDRRKHIVS